MRVSRSLRVPVTLFATALISLVAAACDDGTVGGEPTSPPQNGSPPSSPGVPTVADPLDAGPFLSDPCKLVDEATVASIGEFDPGEADVDSPEAKNLTGPSCGWDGKDNFGLDLSVTIGTVHQRQAEPKYRGIAGIYGGKEAGLVDEFEPAEVAGHPGYPAAYAWLDGDRERGRCPLYVGIADDLTFTATVQNEDQPDAACPAAQKAAAAVLVSLKRGS
jgi:hypothetical protein